MIGLSSVATWSTGSCGSARAIQTILSSVELQIMLPRPYLQYATLPPVPAPCL